MTAPLPAQARAVVAFLQHHAGRAVSFADLAAMLWPHDERGIGEQLCHLHQLIHLARKELPADAISTAPGFGYAWTGKRRKAA